MSTLTIFDHGEPIAIGFDDLLKYHGRGFVGGVAHGFKVMERAFPLLAEGKPLERYDIRIETAFPGPGARDAFEMVTRAVTGARYRVDPDLAGPDVTALRAATEVSACSCEPTRPSLTAS